MRVWSPGVLLLCAAVLCAAVAALATFAAVSQPWLGLNLAYSPSAAAIASVDAEGPSAQVPVGTLIAVGGMAIEPHDVIPEADANGRYPIVDSFYARQKALAALQAGETVALTVQTTAGGSPLRSGASTGEAYGCVRVAGSGK